MRDRIWAELTQTKHDSEFLGLYSDYQRTILRWFNIGILVFSTGGVMGWPIWDKIPMISCIIIAAVSLLRLIQPHLIMNDKMLNDLDRINIFVSDKFNNLEKLWYDLECTRIDENAATQSFYELKNNDREIKTLIDETVKYKPKKIIQKAKEYSDNYFKQVFKTPNHE